MTYLVKDFMEKDFPSIDGELSVYECSKTIAKSPRGYAIVLKEGKPKGIICERDLIRRVYAKELNPTKVKVSEVMSSPLITIDPEKEISKATKIMKEKNVRKLPVVRDDIIYGLITARDITDHFTDYVDKAIREIIRWTPI